LESDLLMGEAYDARREHSDNTRWSPVELLPGTRAALVATNGPTVRRQAELRPLALRALGDPHNPRWLFDLGQNMVGWVRLRVSGPAGTTVTLRYAEVLNADGSLYTANLRTARSTD